MNPYKDLDDFCDFLGLMLLLIIIGGIALICAALNGEDRKKEIIGRSDSVVILSMGKSTSSYYTTKQSITFVSDNKCISFIDNTLNTTSTACGDFIIKTIPKETK